MSNGRNNFASTPSLGNWRNRHDYDAYAPNYNNNNNDSNRLHFLFPRNPSFRDDPIFNSGVRDPWHSHEEGMIIGSFSSDGFPSQPRPPLRIPVRQSGVRREVNQRPRQAIPINPPGRFIAQPNMPISAQEENSRLTQDEQNKGLTKLKKEIYNPTPKKLSRRLSLYYRDHTKLSEENGKIGDNDDGKRCAICLEDFEPKEMVMLTPCNHMFHEECIVPWVKSNGQCPVCRFLICEQARGTTSAVNNGSINNGNIAVNDLLAGELVLILRAMEEAFILGSVSR